MGKFFRLPNLVEISQNCQLKLSCNKPVQCFHGNMISSHLWKPILFFLLYHGTWTSAMFFLWFLLQEKENRFPIRKKLPFCPLKFNSIGTFSFRKINHGHILKPFLFRYNYAFLLFLPCLFKYFGPNLQSQLFQVMLKLLHTSNIFITWCLAGLEIFSERIIKFFFIFIFSPCLSPRPDTSWFSISVYWVNDAANISVLSVGLASLRTLWNAKDIFSCL